MDFLIQIDKQIFFLINNIQNKFLDILVSATDWIAEFALVWIIICFFILLFDKKEKKKKIFVILISLVVGSLITEVILKGLFFRERPYLVFEGVKTLGRMWQDSSFPSGHVASSIAAVTAIMLVYKIKNLWKILLLASVLAVIGFSRIYSGAHYPSDVLAGALIGIISGIISFWLYGITQGNA
jgi:undecaprenyl-diphosphatase